MSFSEFPNDAPLPDTLAQGELTPPPRKPPTAIAAAPFGPEPRLPRPRPVHRRALPLPRELVRAVDSSRDVLDDLGDALRSALGRAAT